MDMLINVCLELIQIINGNDKHSQDESLKRHVQMLSEAVNWKILFSCQEKFRHGRFTDECAGNNS